MATRQSTITHDELPPGVTLSNEARFTTDPTALEERGRLQFFYHSKETELPVRDVTNTQGKGQKTEPYLEGHAENFCSECYQSNNILPHLKSPERYVFLQTTCRHPDSAFEGDRYIVGYLEKKRVLDMVDHYAVQGPIAMFSFEDGYACSRLKANPDKPRMYKLDREETEDVLDHFAGKKDIYEECLEKTVELETKIGRNLPNDALPTELSRNHSTCGSSGC